MSVRKSHLVGKNHIKYYCQYYEQKAKQQGIWNPHHIVYEVTLDRLNAGAPGSPHKRSGLPDALPDSQAFLPPPPNLAGFPNPPPSVLRNTDEFNKAISQWKS
jgi:U1 small nuclear ribonucleoprotein C